MDILTAFLAGLVGAAIMVFLLDRFRRRPSSGPIAPSVSQAGIEGNPFAEETDGKQALVDHRIKVTEEAAKDRSFQKKVRDLTLREEYRDLAAYKAEIERELLARQHVVGLAIGNRIRGGKTLDELVVSVLVDQKIDEDRLADEEIVREERLPNIENIRREILPERGSVEREPLLDVVQVGRQATAAAVPPLKRSLRERVRPVIGGVSVGHYQGLSGTLATCCYEQESLPVNPNLYYMLSNNHVFAKSNSAAKDDPILQPGPQDNGQEPDDVIGWLTAFVPVQGHDGSADPPTNYVDAAIAVGHLHDLNREIYWTGHLNGCDYAPKVGDLVQKTGSSTGFTLGRIVGVDATVDIQFGNVGDARFRHQIVIQRFTFGGDSGSLVVNSSTKRAVGLLFANSVIDDQKVSVANPILFVEQLLGIRVSDNGEPQPELILPQ